MINKVELIGWVGKDAELVGTERKFISLRLATSEKYSKNGEIKEETQWHSILYLGNNADNLVNYLRKGTLVRVEGKIKYGKYTAADGFERSTVDITTFDLRILSKINQEQPAGAQAKDNVDDDEDLPF